MFVHSFLRLNWLFFRAGLLLVAFSASSAWGEFLVEVFADGPVEVQSRDRVRVVAYNLDEITDFSNNAPTFDGRTVEQARAKAEAFMRSDAYRQYQQEVQSVYRPLQKMAEYRLAKIPAIVINGRYIVYGTTDVGRALDDYIGYLDKP